jgi:hypothetical protein
MDIREVHVTVTTNVILESDYVNAFNAWMDEYMTDPGRFQTCHQGAMKHLEEKLGGKEPSYGQVATATLFEYLKKTMEEK